MEVFCPAKINLMLAVTGRRGDGYHELVTVLAPLDFGDTLRLEPDPGGGRSFACSDERLAMDASNLVVRAARAFDERYPTRHGYRLHLEKQIPVGAGLGGGSSDAAGALRLLNRFAGEPLSPAELSDLAAGLGADCPFFLAGRAMIARGTGDRLEPLPDRAQGRLAGAEMLLLKPSFGVSTPWAYRRMAERGGDYCRPQQAEEHLRQWLESDAPATSLFWNSMEAAVFEKYLALPVMREALRERGAAVLMSGSGSTLIAAADGSDTSLNGKKLSGLEMLAVECWGSTAWTRRVRLR